MFGLCNFQKSQVFESNRLSRKLDKQLKNYNQFALVEYKTKQEEIVSYCRKGLSMSPHVFISKEIYIID
jgi:hypothetical protein